VEEQLRAIGRPRPARRAPPPEGRLDADEQPGGRLGAALADLGPVFSDFGRYLSSRVDLLPRRDCLELVVETERTRAAHVSGAEALVSRQLGDTPERRFVAFDPIPRAITPWTQQHDAWLATGEAVAVTIVRPDADRILNLDVPLLPLVAPWLDAPADAVAAAIGDFSLTLRSRLDQTQQATAFARLFEDAQAGGPLDAPRCHPDYCAPSVLTLERIDGLTIAEALATQGARSPEVTIDREAVARQLASAWLRQGTTGQVVPFDFDLRDVRLRGNRLVLVGGVLEPLTRSGRTRFLSYLTAVAADDPDKAWTWIASAAAATSEGVDADALQRRLRQAVPFRDGEWSGDDRLAEQLLVQWRATREAGWTVHPHELHLYRGIHAVSATTSQVAPHQDMLLAALQDERLRAGFSEARNLFDSRSRPAALEQMVYDLVHLPRKLDEILTLAASGRLRIKAEVPDAGERRQTRNHTVSLVASLVTLVALTFLVRHLAPAYGANLERMGAVLILAVGGWLLSAAARL